MTPADATIGAMTDTATTVRALLDAAGLTVSDEEFDLFVRVYPGMRSSADGMYLAETRTEEPALIFIADWKG
jgi:hypothetical protein